MLAVLLASDDPRIETDWTHPTILELVGSSKDVAFNGTLTTPTSPPRQIRVGREIPLPLGVTLLSTLPDTM